MDVIINNNELHDWCKKSLVDTVDKDGYLISITMNMHEICDHNWGLSIKYAKLLIILERDLIEAIKLIDKVPEKNDFDNYIRVSAYKDLSIFLFKKNKFKEAYSIIKSISKDLGTNIIFSKIYIGFSKVLLERNE